MLNQLKEITKETFNKIYDDQYRIKEIVNGDSQVNYVIIEELEGIIVDFWVSRNGIFQASSKNGLLNNKYESKLWLTFIETLEDRLKEE